LLQFDIGALVRTTVFDEILICALCSANSSKPEIAARLRPKLGLLIKSVEMASKSSFQDEKRERKKREKREIHIVSVEPVARNQCSKPAAACTIS
jgi:hypothetical protein